MAVETRVDAAGESSVLPGEDKWLTGSNTLDDDDAAAAVAEEDEELVGLIS